jgi:hypothetical protein
MANIERGFWRITLVISVVVLMAGLYIMHLMRANNVEFFALPLCTSAIPWGLFYVFRWIARGFYR